MRTKENFHQPIEAWQQYNGFSTDIITDLSIDWLKERDQDKPFMLMTHFKATHEPFDFPSVIMSCIKMRSYLNRRVVRFFETDSSRTIKGKFRNLIWRWQEALKILRLGGASIPNCLFCKGLDADAARKKAYQKLVKDFMFYSCKR